MQIWVDADACPNPIKEILFRAAARRQLPTILVANQPVRTPSSRLIRSVQVAPGFDMADHYIVQHMQRGDLVITADIPLAADVVEGGGHALNPRGELYTPDNIRQRLVMRDFMEQMRGAGLVSGGPAVLGTADRKAFGDALDRFLARHT
jgi:uncharacterized protein